MAVNRQIEQSLARLTLEQRERHFHHHSYREDLRQYELMRRGDPDAVAEQRSASVLVLPLRNDPDYTLILPGKLFEYLGARRPILGIGQEDGAMARVLSDTQAGVTCDWDNEAGMRAFIDKAWQEHLAGGVPAPSGDISIYTRKNTARALAQLLNTILND